LVFIEWRGEIERFGDFLVRAQRGQRLDASALVAVRDGMTPKILDDLLGGNAW
jgi:hypothetical protein